MFEKKYHLYVDDQEKRILLHSLIELKNLLIQEGRYTDCIDELIVNTTTTPVRKLKVG